MFFLSIAILWNQRIYRQNSCTFVASHTFHSVHVMWCKFYKSIFYLNIDIIGLFSLSHISYLCCCVHMVQGCKNVRGVFLCTNLRH